jgi:outer membrane protein assembly factor BamB
VYLLTNRCEVLCLDAAGMANGNDGPFRKDSKAAHRVAAAGARSRQTRGQARARRNRGRGRRRHLALRHVRRAGRLPPPAGGRQRAGRRRPLYTTTSNGTDWTGTHLPAPDAPALVCLDKQTGKLLGEERVRHQRPHVPVQLVEPRLRRGGRAADGRVRRRRRFLLRVRAGAGRRRPEGDLALRLQPAAVQGQPEDEKPIKYGNSKGVSEVVATPVIHDGRVYVATGQNPESGDGVGVLTCIDATKTGDITGQRQGVGVRQDRPLAVDGRRSRAGLVYAADFSGMVTASTGSGQPKWVHDTEGRIWGSTLVAGGRVYVGTRRALALLVLAAGRRRSCSRGRAGRPVYSTPSLPAA